MTDLSSHGWDVAACSLYSAYLWFAVQADLVLAQLRQR